MTLERKVLTPEEAKAIRTEEVLATKNTFIDTIEEALHHLPLSGKVTVSVPDIGRYEINDALKLYEKKGWKIQPEDRFSLLSETPTVVTLSTP